MDKVRKIELGLVILFVIFNLVLLLNNSSISGFFLYGDEELSTPGDFISKEDIIVEENKIIIKIENYTLSQYDFTNSMIPFFDNSANGVGVKPDSTEDLNVGDIITFRQDEKLIVHRIIQKGTDKEGVYFITKGDNNGISDGKIRFSEVESKLVAIFY